MHQRIGDEDGPPAHAQDQREAKGDATGGRLDRMADVVEAHRGRTGEPGHHRIGIAGRHHAGGEHVAILVHHALAVALQEAAALQAAIQEVDILRVGSGQPCIVDLDALDDAEAEARHRRFHPVLAADQHRPAIAGIAVGDGGAHHLLLLALGEHHAARVGTHALHDRVERTRGGIQPARQIARIAPQIDHRLASDAAFHRRARHRRRHPGDQPRIERVRDDVFGPEGEPCVRSKRNAPRPARPRAPGWPAPRPRRSSSPR